MKQFLLKKTSVKWNLSNLELHKSWICHQFDVSCCWQRQKVNSLVCSKLKRETPPAALQLSAVDRFLISQMLLQCYCAAQGKQHPSVKKERRRDCRRISSPPQSVESARHQSKTARNFWAQLTAGKKEKKSHIRKLEECLKECETRAEVK